MSDQVKLNHFPEATKMVELLRTYNKWRRDEIEGSMDDLGLHPSDIGKAIDAVLDDYAALQSECERLRAELSTVKKVVYGNLELLDEVEQLRAEIAAIKAQDPVGVMFSDGEILSKRTLGAAFGSSCASFIPLYALNQPQLSKDSP